MGGRRRVDHRRRSRMGRSRWRRRRTRGRSGRRRRRRARRSGWGLTMRRRRDPDRRRRGPLDRRRRRALHRRRRAWTWSFDGRALRWGRSRLRGRDRLSRRRILALRFRRRLRSRGVRLNPRSRRVGRGRAALLRTAPFVPTRLSPGGRMRRRLRSDRRCGRRRQSMCGSVSRLRRPYRSRGLGRNWRGGRRVGGRTARLRRLRAAGRLRGRLLTACGAAGLLRSQTGRARLRRRALLTGPRTAGITGAPPTGG